MELSVNIPQVNPMRREGLSLSVSAKGRVEFITKDLANKLMLDVNMGSQVIYFNELLALPFPEQTDWPYLTSDVIDICFKSASKEIIHMRGHISGQGHFWGFYLVDISDYVERSNNNEKELYLLQAISRFYLKYQQSRAEGRQHAVEDILDDVLVTVKAQAIGVVTKTDMFENYRLIVQRELPTAGKYITSTSGFNALLAERQPIAFFYEDSSGFSREPRTVLFLPFIQEHQVLSWMFVVFSQGNPQRVLTLEKWESIAALLVSAVLDSYNHEETLRTLNKKKFADSVLGGGFWDYNIIDGRVSLSTALAEKIDFFGEYLVELLDRVYLGDREKLELKIDELQFKANGSEEEEIIRLKQGPQLCWYKVYLQLSGSSILGYLLDVTEIKEAQLDQRISKQRLSHLVSSGPAIIYVQRYVEGAFVQDFLSQSILHVLGWKPEDIREQGWLRLLHPEDRPVFDERIKTLIAKGSVSHQYRLRGKDGNYHWMLEEGTLLRDEYGLPLEVVGVLLDNSERKKAEAALSKSEECYRVLVEDAPTAICRCTPDLNLTFANRLLLSYLGVDSLIDRVYPVNLSNYIKASEVERLQERMAKLTMQQPMFNIELCIDVSEYETSIWLWSVRGIFDQQGQLYELQAVGRDDTELHRTRQEIYQNTKMATVGRLASGIAHELNQPLNIMRATLTNLVLRIERNMLDDEYLKDKAERLDAQITRASNIINNMQLFSYKNSRELLDFSPFKTVKSAIELFKQANPEQQFDIAIECLFDGYLKGCSELLEQVILNLLENAWHAFFNQVDTSERQLKVIIEIYQINSQVFIEVQDNAGGIPAEIIDKVFDPFFTTKSVGSGTGLGLCLCYEIVTRFQGKLSVANKKQGACFKIQLPVFEF